MPNLKDIKDLLIINAVDYNLDKDDVEWLVEQAEKVELLEKVNLVSTHLMTDKQLEKLRKLINK